MNRKIMGMVLIVAMFAFILSGCAKTEAPQTLKIGVMSDIGAAPFIVAKENGYFEKLGLDVEITVFKSAVDRDTAMQTGNLDGAMADMLTIVFYKDAGFESKITSATYGNYVMVTTPSLVKAEIDTVDPLRVGISANTVIDFATDQVAFDGNMVDRMLTIAIPQMPVRLEMLAAGELEAATLPEPLASAAVLGGGEKVKGTIDLGLQPGVFIMSESAIKDKSSEIEMLYEGYNQGVDYLNESNQEDYIGLLVEQLGFPPSLVGTFDFPTLVHAQSADEVTFATVLDWMKGRGLTTSEWSFSDLQTTAFIK